MWARAALATLIAISFPIVATPSGEAQETPVILWITTFGTSRPDVARDIAADDTGVYVTGTTFGAFPGHSTDGFADAFLAKFDHGGGALWTTQSEAPGVDGGSGVAADGTSVSVVGTAGLAVLQRYDPSGALLWERRFAIGILTSGNGVAISGTDVYVVGTEGLDATILDFYVRKYDIAGNPSWTHTFGDSSKADWGSDVVATGNAVFVAGRARFGSTLPGQVSAGLTDAYVQKLAPDGTVLWTRQFGTSEHDVAQAVGAAGTDTYVAGYTQGAFEGQAFGGATDAFVRKYDDSGNVVWTREFGAAGLDSITAVSADATGAYVAGWAEESLSGSVAGDAVAFVRRYTADGRECWTRQFAPLGDGGIEAMAVTAQGVFVTGPVGAEPGQLPQDAYVAKLRVPGPTAGCATPPAYAGYHPTASPVTPLLGRKAFF